MKVTDTPFSPSDARLLLCLIYARQPADREKINAIDDFIDRSYFSDEELDSGLNRLMAAGHVLRAGELFAASQPVLDWYTGATKKRSYVHKDLERVQSFLARTSASPADAAESSAEQPAT